MDSHLAKPFDPNTLLAAVVRAAGAGSSRTQHLDSTSQTNIAISTAAVPVIGLELLVFNLNAFERTASFLTPAAIADYLQTIAGDAEDLLQGLRKPDALTHPGNTLAEAAHKLAGSAGMFGFDRLTNLARRFERAAQLHAADAPALSESLAAAIEVSLKSIGDRLLVDVEG